MGKNGVAGLNFEHSWGDGIAVLRYFSEVYKDSTKNPHIHPGSECNMKSAEYFVSPLGKL